MGVRSRDQATHRGDDTPIVGGIEDISRFLTDRPVPTIDTTDELAREILTLLALHPDIVVQCRQANFDTMDEATKRALLGDIRRCLNIEPFRKREL